MQTLHDSLLSYNVEDLKSRSRLLTIKAPSTRKATLSPTKALTEEETTTLTNHLKP